MQEISMKPTARIYNFSELQKKKRQRELREKRPFFITGIVLIISLLCISFFLYSSAISPLRSGEPSSTTIISIFLYVWLTILLKHSSTDIQYKVVEIKAGDSLWSIAKENMSDELNHSGFTDIYQYIHEIKKCNNMKSNQINAGCYLMVPYYK